MEYDRKLLQDVKALMIARYPRFGAEIASTNLEYRTDLKYHTAATDGENIYFDPNYLASLSDDDKLFIIAHELMHVKFEHVDRIMGKDGKERDHELWNTATDAIINANLERDGFKIKEGYVNMPEALNYNAEEFYEKLLKQKQQQQSENKQNQGQDGRQNQNNGQQEEQDGQGGIDSPWKGHNGDYQGKSGERPDANGQNNSSNQRDGAGQNSANDQNGNKEDQGGQGTGESRQFADDHSLWEKALEERKKQNRGENQSESKTADEKQIKDSKLGPNAQIPEFEEVKFDEKSQFQQNREERRERAKRNMERMRDAELKKSESGIIEFGDVGEAKPILDWRLLLRREVEKTETTWSQRRSIAENNYAYRLEENDVEDEAETEVMIDVSGSVSLEMVKAFLRQLKPILKESRLKVGCFNAKFWGVVEIKSNRDIDNFKIPKEARGSSAWTEDWDLAVRSFSKRREVNKIVFTDGEPCPGTMPKDDLKNVNVIWLVYSNRNFRPCCGKVIDIYPKDLENMANAVRTTDEPGL